VVKLSTINRDNLRNCILFLTVNFENLRLVDAYSLPDINILQNVGGGGQISDQRMKKSEQG